MSNKTTYCVDNPHKFAYQDADEVLVEAASKSDAEAIVKKLPKKLQRYIANCTYDDDYYGVLVLAASDEDAWQMIAVKAQDDAEQISNAFADDIARDNSPRDNASVELHVELCRINSNGREGSSVKSRTFHWTYDADPECDSSEGDHDWCSPQSIVGGLDENPGVFSRGSAIEQIEVCSNCGMYRTSWFEPDKADKIAYAYADKASDAWVESLAEDEEEED